MSKLGKRALVVAACLLAIGLGLYFGLPAYVRHIEDEEIREGWTRLAEARSIGNLAQMEKRVYLVIRFGDGDYLALCSHADCCDTRTLHTGDYTLGLTGRGKKIFSTHHFCGSEGLHGELAQKQYRDLRDFLSQTSECNWSDAGREPTR
jgi:7-keto-8-aminopelargonate synthetase-like enzyme